MMGLAASCRLLGNTRSIYALMLQHTPSLAELKNESGMGSSWGHKLNFLGHKPKLMEAKAKLLMAEDLCRRA